MSTKELVVSEKILGEEDSQKEGAYIIKVRIGYGKRRRHAEYEQIHRHTAYEQRNYTIAFVVKCWVLPSDTMEIIDKKVDKSIFVIPLANRNGEYVKPELQAFRNNREAPVSWDVTIEEVDVKYLTYETDSYHPFDIDRYYHTRERLRKYKKEEVKIPFSDNAPLWWE